MKKNKIKVDLLLKSERSTIDRLDSIIVNALIERFSVTDRIGVIKAEYNINTVDTEREKRQVEALEGLLRNSELDKSFISKLMELITSESKRNHEKIKREIGD